MWHTLNGDLVKVQEYLCCNKLSFNTAKTNFMAFTPRNRTINDVNTMIHNKNIVSVHVTKFLFVQLTLDWNGKACWTYFGNVLINLQHKKYYTNHVLSTYTIHLHILILYSVTKCGSWKHPPCPPWAYLLVNWNQISVTFTNYLEVSR